MTRIALLSGVATTLGLAVAPIAAPALAQAAPSMTAATSQAIPYLATAGEADVYEISSSQVAVMRSQNPDVRAFATMLIDHHTRTTNLALAAAKSAGVMAPPPILGTQHRAMIGQLLSAPAPEFDRAYLAQQVPAHQTALAVHSGYASSGDVAALRATAESAVPIVQRHLDRARALQAGGM